MRIAFALVLTLATSGCATFLSGTKQSVIFPIAADTALRVVVLDAKDSVVAEGKPPFAVDLSRARTYRVVAAGPGIAADTVRVSRGFNAITLWNIFIAPGFLVDLGTGAYRTQRVPQRPYLLGTDARTISADLALWGESERASPRIPTVEELRTRRVFFEGDDLSHVYVQARSDGYVAITSRYVSMAETCLLRPDEARASANLIAREFSIPTRVSPGEESRRRSESLGLLCAVEIEVVTTATSRDVRIVHDTGAGIEIRSKVASLSRFAASLAEAADTTVAMSAAR